MQYLVAVPRFEGEMVIAAIIIGFMLFTSTIVLSACILSARISQTEDWGEVPLREEGIMPAGHGRRVASTVPD